MVEETSRKWIYEVSVSSEDADWFVLALTAAKVNGRNITFTVNERFNLDESTKP